MTVSFKKIIIGTMIASMALSAGAALAQDNYSTNTNAPTPMLTSTRQPAVKKTIDLPCGGAVLSGVVCGIAVTAPLSDLTIDSA